MSRKDNMESVIPLSRRRHSAGSLGQSVHLGLLDTLYVEFGSRAGHMSFLRISRLFVIGYMATNLPNLEDSA